MKAILRYSSCYPELILSLGAWDCRYKIRIIVCLNSPKKIVTALAFRIKFRKDQDKFFEYRKHVVKIIDFFFRELIK